MDRRVKFMASKFKVVGFSKLSGESMEIENNELARLNIDAEVVAAR